MKRLLALMMVLVLTLTSLSIPVLAEDWTCANCGSTNSDNFCPDCGAKKPEALKCAGCGYQPEGGSFKFCPQCGLEFGQPAATPTPRVTATPRPTATPRITATPKPNRTFEITGMKLNDNGTVRVNWTDSAENGPYKVCYEQKVSNDYTSSAQNAITRWIAEQDLDKYWCKITDIEPGVSYWISIYDKDGNVTRSIYSPSRVRSFTEFTVKMQTQLIRQQGSQSDKVARFSAAEMESNTRNSYGMWLKLTYSQLRKKRNYAFVMTVTDPNGIIRKTTSSNINMPRGVSWYEWDFFDMTSAFNDALKNDKSIPTGQWTVSIYFDGLFVNSANFRVGN